MRHPTLPTYPADFNVYFCAASLVRTGHAAQLYAGADTGADPQKALAPLSSPIYTVAASHGLPFVGLYVYPPLLADLLVPLTYLSLPAATHAWLALNCALLLATALLLAALLQVHWLSWRTGLLVLVTFCFTPALQCLVDGQITILLLFLWVAGATLYQREQEGASGAVFALATAIKLTPALVLLPMLVWRRGRFLAAYAAGLLLMGAVCAGVNTPGTLRIFISRVLPAMSGATPVYANFALPASVQRFLTLLQTGSVPAFPGVLPSSVIEAGRLASSLVLLGVLLLLVRMRTQNDREVHVRVLCLLSLLAPVLSPVSWFHAYTTALLAFALLWQDAVQHSRGMPYVLGLTAVSLCLGTAVSENLVPRLLFSGYGGLSACLHLGQLLAAIGLVLCWLWRYGNAAAHGAASPLSPSLPAS